MRLLISFAALFLSVILLQLSSGGVAPLVELLKDGLRDERVQAQEYALWSLSLVTDATSRATIFREGCIQLLVACLVNGLVSLPAQEHAAAVLACLARLPSQTLAKPPATLFGGSGLFLDDDTSPETVHDLPGTQKYVAKG